MSIYNSVTGSLTMPPGRSEDGALTTLTELSLILVYLCVLVIKTCDVSSEACSLFGFGDAKGAGRGGSWAMCARASFALCKLSLHAGHYAHQSVVTIPMPAPRG